MFYPLKKLKSVSWSFTFLPALYVCVCNSLVRVMCHFGRKREDSWSHAYKTQHKQKPGQMLRLW